VPTTTNKLITLALIAVALTTTSCHDACHPEEITKDEIIRRTQELSDAVAAGNKAPWQKYFADDVLFFDEKGRDMNKQALVADVEPLPAGYSGTIKVENSKINQQGNTLIHAYDQNETEIIHGQELHARYHATDTWMYRNGQWQIVAEQVLRYYEDPAIGVTDPKTFPDYVGTYGLDDLRQTVSIKDGKLYLARGTKPPVELLTESGDLFFRKGVEGRILFHRTNQKVDTLIDRRNNEDVVWKKLS
jgi:ketosteroid isomerase-like protein